MKCKRIVDRTIRKGVAGAEPDNITGLVDAGFKDYAKL